MVHFVLVHGLGHGAWCWYKVIPLLQKAGHTVTAPDLTSNGINKVPAHSVTSIADYVHPLTQLLESLTPHDPKVVLVGHSLGGSTISYAMELFPHKISRAIFLTAFMFPIGSVFFPYLDLFLGSNTLAPNFADDEEVDNGDNTCSKKKMVSASIHPDSILQFYSRTPSEDICLARSCLNPTPISPFPEMLNLSKSNYGSIPRYYIITGSDEALPPSMQASMVEQNPPHKVITLPDSDHSPFFSDPSSLVDVFISIALEPIE